MLSEHISERKSCSGGLAELIDGMSIASVSRARMNTIIGNAVRFIYVTPAIVTNACKMLSDYDTGANTALNSVIVNYLK